jgi:hypothetical protein
LTQRHATFLGMPLRQTVCRSAKTPTKTHCVIDPKHDYRFGPLWIYLQNMVDTL